MLESLYSGPMSESPTNACVSIIAIMLGHFQMSVEETMDFCFEFARKVFPRQKLGVQRTMALLGGSSRYSFGPVIPMLETLTQEKTGAKRKPFLTQHDSACKT